LGGRLPVQDTEEIGGLAEALNVMAAQLGDRIGDVKRRQSEQEAVLKSMVEGVLAVDPEERLLNINEAASELLRVKPGDAIGRAIQEVVRNTDLHRFVARALLSRGPVEGEITLTDGGERHIQAHGAPLRDVHGQGIGAVVVLHDVTKIRRLESVRREFVANVSHELKTPVTSIKGYVETLLDGALEDGENARRFLDVIARQSDRLGAIIDDLLSLSRIEQDAERAEIPLEPGPLGEVVRAAVQVCAVKAREKDIRIDVRCPEDLRAPINAPLLEQAVVNLIDNAVKYSEPGSAVQVDGRAEGAEAVIEVRDRGVGIDAEHLPRIFERFYRVDK
ncbi:MAG: PAS domain-containing protein, partial [Candidatus Methylomirabilis sp.]|nr:PAS domain-containing protein [Deltaproteobacteria bacterium]